MTSPNPPPDDFTRTTVTGESVPQQSEPTPRCDDVTRVVSEELASQQNQPAHRAPAPPGYEIISEIGRGGMGVVYKAKQRGLNRIVALKVVLAGGHASAGQRARFLAEGEAVAALNHVGIVGVYEYGTWDGQPYMALEYCPGGTLAEKLRGTPLPPNDACVLLEHMARALAVAHDRGIIHRDIKPSNVLLAPDGTPKIADFGLAKMTTITGSVTLSGAVLGTPSYMAPEQARGDAKHVGPPADVYALGAVLYECLTGRPPFKGSTPADTIIMALEREPVSVRALNPSVPVDLETVCLKCLEKDPLRRYQTALALADDLERFRTGRPVVARPVGPLGRARRWVARNQVISALLAAIALTVFAGTTTTYLKYLDEVEQRGRADIAKADAIREAGAKEEALQQLRKTLTQLEHLTEEQKRTLIRLSDEKAASEDALLRGLLRPLRNHPGNAVTLEEARVLFEVAALPEERLRFRLIERGLATKEGTEKLRAWPQEIVGATAGLDRAAAVRLRSALADHLRLPGLSGEARVACAFLVAPLPKDDAEVNRLAVRVLVRTMAERPPTGLAELPDGLLPLVPRLAGEDAGEPARTLLGRIVRESDATALVHLGAAFVPLVERMDGPDAVALARLLVDEVQKAKDPAVVPTLCSALGAAAPRFTPADAEPLAVAMANHVIGLPAETQADTNAIQSCVAALAVIGDRLPAETRQSLLAPVVKVVAAHLESTRETQSFFNLTSSVMSLGVRSGPADRNRVAKILVDRILVENDSLVLSNTAYSLTELAPRMTAAETMPLAKAVAGRLTRDFDPILTMSLTACLANLALRFTPEDAAEVVRGPAGALVARITAESPMQGISTVSSGFWPIGRAVGANDAAHLAELLINRTLAEKNPEAVSYLAYALLPLVAKLTPEACDGHSKRLADRMSSEKDATVIGNLTAALSALTGRLEEAAATACATRVVNVVVKRIVAEKDPAPISSLASTLSTLASRVPVADAARHAKDIAARMLTEKDAMALSHYSAALVGFVGRLSTDEAAALVSLPVQAVVDRLLSETDPNYLYHTTTAFSQLAPKLSPAEATESVRRVLDRMFNQRDSALHYYYGSATAAGAPHVSQDAAAGFVRLLLTRLPSEADTNALPALCAALTAFAPRMRPEEAVTVARGLAERMVQEKDATLLQRLGDTFAASLAKVPEEELLALLRPNTAFPPIRVPLMAEFGLRSRRMNTSAAGAVAGSAAPAVTPSPPFPNVWEFMDWAEKARPLLDLHPAPAVQNP